MPVRLALSWVQHGQNWDRAWHMVKGGGGNSKILCVVKMPAQKWMANSESTPKMGIVTWGSDWALKLKKQAKTSGITPEIPKP